VIIGVNTLSLQPGYGGREAFIHNTLRAIQAHSRESHFVLFTDPGNHEAFEGWKRVQVDGPKALGDAVAEARVQILLSPLESALAKCPVAQCVLVMDLQKFPNESGGWRWLKGGAQRAAHQICSEARSVIAPSEFIKRELLQKLEVAMEKIVVCPLGVDPAFDTRQAPFVEPPYILTVGRTDETKNVAMLRSVMATLWQEIPHSLVVVGQAGDAEPEDWGPRVIRVEQAPSIQLAALYQHCELVVLPSAYEGSGVAALEGLRAGTTVVCGRVGGIPEVAHTAPIYFNPENRGSLAAAIRRGLGEKPSERRSRHEAGRKLALEFTWDRCASKTMQALRRT